MICELCFHHCDLSEGQTGFCRARACRGGAIVPLNYGKVTSLALDPIGKKPLRRFRPGSRILSVGSFGCNLYGPFCQNHEISMSGNGELKTIELSPEALADKPPTSVERVCRLADAARMCLSFVYTGNC